MGQRCKLCRRRMTDRDQDVGCTCGWALDADCAANHHPWCPTEGRDRWVGAVEL